MRLPHVTMSFAFVCALILGACAGTPAATTASSQPAANEQDITGDLRAANWGGNPTENSLVKKYIDDFMKKYPKIKVTQEQIPDQFEDKIKTEMTAGSEPDAMYVSTKLMNFAAPAGRLLELGPLMAKWGVSRDEFVPSLVAPWEYKGKLYGLPKDFGDLAIFYNKKMFAAAGLQPPKTWDDVKAAAKTLTKGEVKGISLPDDSARWNAFLFAWGGKVLSDDGTKAVFNDKAAIDSATFYSSFQTQDKSSDLPKNLGATWPGDAFGKEKAAMAIEGGWLIPYMKDTYPSVEYGAVALPPGPAKQASLLFTNAWGCAAKTKNADACMLFVKYMTGKDVQKQVLESGFALPSRKDLANDPFFSSHANEKTLFDSATFAVPWTFGPHEAKIQDAMNNALGAILLGKSSVKDALDKAVQEANTALTQ
ncbi:MAG: ABC transporter substrate-binding protein [Candidatus Limnocylindria bacterium]